MHRIASNVGHLSAIYPNLSAVVNSALLLLKKKKHWGTFQNIFFWCKPLILALSFTQWTILRCRWVIFSLKFEWERLYPVYSRSLIWDCCWFSLVMCNFLAVPFGLGNTEAWLSDRPCNSQLILVMLHCIKLWVFRRYWDPLNPYFCIRLLLLLCSAQLQFFYPNWDLLNKTK